MKRRAWLLGGTGAAAAVAGVAWQRTREAASAQTPAAAGLWQMNFDKPEGGTLAMASLRGQPLLLNFWGTWCPPCVKEMPDLDRFSKQFGPQGWRVVGLAVDNLKAVREFLARTPVSYAIGLVGFEGVDLARALGNAQSGLPYTVAIGANGRVLQRKAGATTLDELTRWAQRR